MSIIPSQSRWQQWVATNQFMANLGWLGLSEFGVRITRLLTAIVLARVLDPLAFGVAALVLTVNELIRVFSRSGIGAKIIQCDDQKLDQVCNTAYRLNMVFCLSLFCIQILIAYPVARWYDTPTLVPMLQVLSLTYLLMPYAMVQAALVKREQRLRAVAMIDGGQVAVDNILTAILALAGFGAWAIVLPKFLTSPIWVFGYRRAYKWRPKGPLFSFDLWREVLEFGRYYLSIEVLKTARLNADNIIIGRLLGMEALGIYYFARNAGLGFSLTLINAVNSALYPNLCELSSDLDALKKRFLDNLKKICFIVIPLLFAQAGLAFFYVPIVFGEHWAHAIPILALLCLSAIPRALAESASALMLATNAIRRDFLWNLGFTLLFISVVGVAANFDLLTVVLGVVMVYYITNPLYLIYVWRVSFKSTPPKKSINQKEDSDDVS